jgi:DNA-directed RNA polymerase subunit RPC12/RpoP
MTTALTTTGIAHEPQPCLGCGKMVDAATGVFGADRPEAGDTTVCLYCGHIHVFRAGANGLRLDNPNAKEIREIAGDKRILAVQRARGKVMKTNKR